jgi:two-component system cell cycle response regulator DivK
MDTMMADDAAPAAGLRWGADFMRPEPGGVLRVLLVEDAPFLRYAFGRLLRMHGFEVCEANDGREALDCVAEFRPHLVLTDLMMPVMDGVELIRRLHDAPETADLPVVAITADATDQAERLARQAGAVDVVTKPIDLPALLDRLNQLQLI